MLNIVARQRSAASHMLGGKVVHPSLRNSKWSLFNNRLAVRPFPEMLGDRTRPMLNRADVQQIADRISRYPQLAVRQTRVRVARLDR